MSNAPPPRLRSASWNQIQSHSSRIPQTPHRLPQRSVSEAFTLAGRARMNDSTPVKSSPLSNTLDPESTSDDGHDISMTTTTDDDDDASVFNSNPSTPLNAFSRSLKNAGQQSPVRQRLLHRRHSMQVSANRQQLLNRDYNSTGHTPPSYTQPHPNAPPNITATTPPALSPHPSPINSPSIPPTALPRTPPTFSPDAATPLRQQHPWAAPASAQQIQYQQTMQARFRQQQHQQQQYRQQQQAQSFLQAQETRQQQILEEFGRARMLQLPPPVLWICNLCDLQFTKSNECIGPDEEGRAYCEECIVKCAMRVVNEQKARVAEEEWQEGRAGDAIGGAEGDVEMADGGMESEGKGKGRAAEGQGVGVGVGGLNGMQGEDRGHAGAVLPGDIGAASPSADTWAGQGDDDDMGFEYDAYFSGFSSRSG